MKNYLQTKNRKMLTLTLTVVTIVFCTNFLLAQAPTPTHHWPLTESLEDIVGDKNGTNNGVTFQNDQIRGDVAYFDGDGFARLPQFINGLTELTVALWFRMDEVQAWSRVYTFGTGDQTEPKDVMMVIPVSGVDGMYRFTLSNPGFPWYDIDFPAEMISLELDTWYYSVVVLKPDSLIIYHNDQKVFAEGGIDRQIGTLNDVENALGKSFWPDPLWKGALSDLRVYDTALNPEQVMALYEETGQPTNVPDNLQSSNIPHIYSSYNRINVQLNETIGDEMVFVYNISGSLLATRSPSEINRLDFIPGIYIVRVTGSNINHSSKVVVR